MNDIDYIWWLVITYIAVFIVELLDLFIWRP